VQEKLVQAYPKALTFAFYLGENYWHLGMLFRDNGKLPAALDWYARAADTLGGVLKKQPRHAEAREFLGLVHVGRAAALKYLGRPADAAADYDRALELATKERHPVLRLRRCGVTLARADHARAAAEADAAAKADAAADVLLACGGVHAVAAATVRRDARLPEPERQRLAGQYADRAVQLLRQAVAKGHEDPKPLTLDPDFEPLRPRPDFQQLLAELTAKPSGAPKK
jgi:tetratricopeptide (TPR) repeat protein